MEMSHNETTDYGIGYYQYGDSSGIGRAGFNGLGSGKLSTLLNPVGGEGAILGFGHGSTVSIDVGGKKVDIKSLTGFINFLKTTNNGNIISTPQILAMDNQEATFEVGERVVVGVNKTTTAQGQETTSQDWKDVTIKLVLKPFISPASESIRMEINQEVNQLSPTQSPKALVDTSRSTAKRLIKTNIVIDNGDTAVLGGMMNEKEFENVSKVPILGDIPILGWLFKSKNVSKDKVNMVAFLTPKIIRTKADKTQVLGRAVEDRVDFIKTQGGRDPFGKKMDQLTKGKLDTRGDDKTIK
jgi:general secretion pathway protein D